MPLLVHFFASMHLFQCVRLVGVCFLSITSMHAFLWMRVYLWPSASTASLWLICTKNCARQGAGQTSIACVYKWYVGTCSVRPQRMYMMCQTTYMTHLRFTSAETCIKTRVCLRRTRNMRYLGEGRCIQQRYLGRIACEPGISGRGLWAPPALLTRHSTLWKS